jgi:hypothetical protein
VPNFAHTPNFAQRVIFADKWQTLSITNATWTLGCKSHFLCQSSDSSAEVGSAVVEMHFVFKYFAGVYCMSVFNPKDI